MNSIECEEEGRTAEASPGTESYSCANGRDNEQPSAASSAIAWLRRLCSSEMILNRNMINGVQ